VYKVIKYHTPASHKPLVLACGEKLQFERRQTQWKGWLWCEKQNCEKGWVPESWAQLKDNHCTMKRVYNATELKVDPGETLQPLLIEAEWLLAVASDGKQG
jgi:hypothetical protein